MMDELASKKMEIAGQIVCELIRKDVLPKGINKHSGISLLRNCAQVLLSHPPLQFAPERR